MCERQLKNKEQSWYCVTRRYVILLCLSIKMEILSDLSLL